MIMNKIFLNEKIFDLNLLLQVLDIILILYITFLLRIRLYSIGNSEYF